MNFKMMLPVGMLFVLIGAQCSGAAYDQEKLNRKLCDAAQAGDMAAVQTLLVMGASIDATADNYKQTALHLASENGHAETVQALLDNKACIEAIDVFGSTALHKAALGGHVNMVSVLLAAGACVAKGDNMGDTALHAAAMIGRTKMVQELLANNSCINEVNTAARTALQYAARGGHAETVQALLVNKALVNTIDCWDFTPLQEATESGYDAIVQILLDNGASTDKTDAQYLGFVDPDYEKHMMLLNAVASGDIVAVKELLGNGASISAVNDYSDTTALHEAAKNGHIKMAQTLLARGLPIGSKNKYGRTALEYAAREGHTEMVQTLLENKASIEATDESGSSALHEAAEGGHTAAVQTLLDNIACVAVEGKIGMKALEGAAKNGHAAMVQLLLNKKAPIDLGGGDALREAAERGHGATVQVLLDNGASPDLFSLVANGYIATVKALLGRGFFADVRNEDGETCLHLAARQENVEMVQALLDINACIEVTDKHNRTVLYHAIDRGGAEALFPLINAYYDILIKRCPAIVNDIYYNVLNETSPTLPIEIWEIIATYFSLNDFENFRLVSKNFRGYMYQPFEQVRKLRANYLKKRLIQFLQSPMNVFGIERTIKTVIETELAKARAVDVDGLLQGIVICGGQPRCPMVKLYDTKLEFANYTDRVLLTWVPMRHQQQPPKLSEAV